MSQGRSPAAATKPSSGARKRRWRVQLLCHEDLVPQASIEGLSDEEIAEWRTEYDVLTAVRDLGHEVEVLGVPDDPDAIRAGVRAFRPHVVFNLTTEFHGAAHYDQHVVSYLELLKTDYTGCNPLGMTLARDKGLSKKLLEHDGIPVPDFARFPRKRAVKLPPGLAFPLFVKSAIEEASLGISTASLVHDEAALVERVTYVHDQVGTDAVAEEFIDGREFYVGVMGNERLTAFPLWELHIPNLPDDEPLIATRRVKWDIAYQKQLGIENRLASDVVPKTRRAIERAAKQAYRTLRLSGYARLDLRMRDDGTFYFLEANPNPDITFGEDFADSAEAAGLSYEELIARILRYGRSYRAGWKGSR